MTMSKQNEILLIFNDSNTYMKWKQTAMYTTYYFSWYLNVAWFQSYIFCLEYSGTRSSILMFRLHFRTNAMLRNFFKLS
jgi:hypothetical protein